MGQHMADVNLVPIIMQSRDQSNFVPTNVEDGKFSHWIGVGNDISQSSKIRETIFSDNPIPARAMIVSPDVSPQTRSSACG
jgi:hypothetical protein